MPPRSLLSRLREIWTATAREGGVLPSEDALAQELGASKPTVREALVRLEAEGLVRRAPGAGTFPNLAALDMPARLDRRADYSQLLRDAGFEPSMEVISADWIALDAKRALLLGVPAGFKCFETVKRWSADGVRVMVAVDVIPLKAADTEPDPEASVLRLTELLGNGTVEWISTWPGALNAHGDMADLLGTLPGTAVLTLEHVGVRRHGERCFHAFEYHFAGLVRYGLTIDARQEQ